MELSRSLRVIDMPLEARTDKSVDYVDNNLLLSLRVVRKKCENERRPLRSLFELFVAFKRASNVNLGFH